MGSKSIDTNVAAGDSPPVVAGLRRLSFGRPPVEASPPALLTNSRTLLWSLLVVAAISVYYVFLASVGTFHDQPWQLDYYDQMSEGFRAGHLYIRTAPSPALLAMSDPFRFDNINLWVWDAALYKGRYYMYWGPVPGLLLLAFKVLTGSHERISDQWPTTLFMLGRLYAGAALLLSFTGRVRMRSSSWLPILAIAVFGLANPVPFIAARPHVYEASLVGGQCFFFWGLVFAFWGLERPHRAGRFFLAAGLCWMLAIGCRVTTVVAVPIAVAATLVFSWQHSAGQRGRRLRETLAIGLPVAFVLLAYAAYNYLRFDSIFEFGTTYQATSQPFYGFREYVLPNVFSYLWAPLAWSCRFPFVRVIGGRSLSSIIHWPNGYQAWERVGGLLLSAMWCWLIVLYLVPIVESFLLQGRRSSGARAASRLCRQEGWLIACAVAIVLSMGPVVTLWEASMRYAGDAVGGLVILGTVAASWLLRRVHTQSHRSLRWGASSLVLVLGLQTCFFGALIAFSASDDPFPRHNPELYQQFESALSLCPPSGVAP